MDATPQTPNAADYESLDVSELRLGVRLNLPIHDDRMVLLLSAGQIINESFLENIRKRGLAQVKVHHSELPRIFAGQPRGESREVLAAHVPLPCPERNDWTDEFDELLRSPTELGLPPQGDAFETGLVERGVEPFDLLMKQEYIERQQAAVAQVDKVFDKLLRGNGLDLDGLTTITEEALSDLQGDIDLFVSLGINPHESGYPARHSMHTCMLAIAVGSHLKLDRPTLKELGVGCLIHDSGMLMIDQALVQAPRRLRPSEMLEVSKHPVRIFDKMLDMKDVSRRSAFIAYQMHERPDGSGYPRQRKNEQIHFLSRVAAVADVYVALASPRPYRPGILPHAALQAVTQAAGEGRLDQAAAHALLRTLSAYPLGSYVQLSDGRVGTVLRSNDLEFERPVVETWARGRLTEPSAIVDLSAEKELSILGPLASLTSDLEATHNDVDAFRSLLGGLNARMDEPPRGEPRPRTGGSGPRAFQSYVTVYVAQNGSAPGQMSWRKVTAVSREVSATGMKVVARDEIQAPLVVLAFNPKPGFRLCLKAEVERRNALPEKMWQYDVTFRGKVVEPQFV